jgi:hypothetical protein
MSSPRNEAELPSAPARGGRSGRWRVGLLALAVTLLALLGLRAALPWVLAGVLESQATAALGRVVQIGDLDLGLLGGGAVARDLVVGPLFEGDQPPAALDPESAHFRAASVQVAWSWAALLRREFRIRHAALVSPRLVALRDAEGRLVPVLRPTEGSPEPEEQGGMWPLQLGTLRIDDLHLIFVDREMRERRPLELRMARLELADLVLRGEQIRLGVVALSEPTLRVRRDLDVEALLAGAPEEESPAVPAAQPAETSASPALRVEEVSLQGATLTLLGEEGEAEARLDLRARNVTHARDVRFPLELTLGFEDGVISVNGRMGLVPLAFEGDVSLENLPLAGLARAAGAALPLRVASGTASGSLRADALLPLERPEAVPARVDLSGRIAVDGFEASDPARGVELAWSGLELLLEELALRPARPGGPPERPSASLSELRLRQPVLRVTRSAPVAAEPTASAAAAAPGPPAAPESDHAPLPVRIALLEVEDGQLEFVDETVKPRHRSQLRELALHAEGLRWPERDVGVLSLAGRGSGESRLAVEAALRGGAGRLDLDLERVALPPFSPYTAREIGYWIEKGAASLHAECGIRGSGYEIEGDLSLRRFGVSELTPGIFEKQFGLPLDLALALLRDPKGRIELPIATSVARGKGDVDVAAIVVSALRQALVGALATPLKGVGLVLHRGDAGEEGAYFEPLSAAPGVGSVEIADARGFVEILEARPGVALRLRGRAGPRDQTALAARILVETASAGEELPSVDAGFLRKRRLRGALEARARGEATGLGAEDAALLDRWLEGVKVPAARRKALARARAESVREALIRDHGVDPARVEIGKALEGEPGVRVELAPFRAGSG